MATKHQLQQNLKNVSKKRKTHKSPEANFFQELSCFSKSKDLNAAISLYDSAVSSNIRLNQQHFNIILYLCSTATTDPGTKELALSHGFRIFDHMLSSKIPPSEASFTASARLAAARGDGDYALELVKKMGDYGLTPRLRTYEPALLYFCGKLEAEKAYVVEEHMGLMGVSLEEAQFAALLKVSAETGIEGRVYTYLHKLRVAVRCVTKETARVIEAWFCGKGSRIGGSVNYEEGLVKEAILKKGGGWHGLGWIGEGNWVVRREHVKECGRCSGCGELLSCVDIDDVETEKFARSVAGLALEREVHANFREFQDWLEEHSASPAIVDGANIGLYQQNFVDGGFSVPQLSSVVKRLYESSGNRWPLVVLHTKRLKALMEDPSHRKLLQEWMDNGILYSTPHGSNDDWYWLYAAVRLKCLIVTNDEMRDHIFELLGRSFFLTWKERHQVRYTFLKGEPQIQMPPPYSTVIQESGKGSWHVPIADESKCESTRTWLCITRRGACNAPDEAATAVGTSESQDSREASGNSNENGITHK